jgi:hypothetical protein
MFGLPIAHIYIYIRSRCYEPELVNIFDFVSIAIKGTVDFINSIELYYALHLIFLIILQFIRQCLSAINYSLNCWLFIGYGAFHVGK